MAVKMERKKGEAVERVRREVEVVAVARIEGFQAGFRASNQRCQLVGEPQQGVEHGRQPIGWCTIHRSKKML